MEIQLFQYHPVIGYTFTPNLKTRFEHEGGGYLVRVNNAGFRAEHEFVAQKSGDNFRVLLFGDSFTAGDSVSNKYRYSDVLETLIPNLEVYNFGLPGTGTDQHYLVFREIAKSYDFDAVVIAVQIENIRRIAARHRVSQTSEGQDILIAKPYFEIGANKQLELKNIPVPKEPLKPEDLSEGENEFVDRGGKMSWLRSAVNKMGGRVKDLAQQISQYQPLPQYDDADGDEWILMKTILQKWVDEIEKPVIIMPIPLYQYIEGTTSPENYRKRFAELNEWENVIVYDPFDDYLKLSKQERRGFRFKTDIHPTPNHHRFLAEFLAKKLAEFTGNKATGANAE